MEEILRSLYLSINEQKIKNRIDSNYWIYSTKNIVVKEQNINKRYIKILFFNRKFNEEDNLMRLYLKVNGTDIIQEAFTPVSEYENRNIMGFVLPIDLADSGNEVIIDGYIVDGHKIDIAGVFVENIPNILPDERLLAYKEYVYHGDANLITYPVLEESKWMCSCGYINSGSIDSCQLCHQSKEQMNYILTFNYQEVVLCHLMERIKVNLNETIDETIHKYCFAIYKKYNISEEVVRARIDIDFFKNKQKELLKETIYDYVNNNEFRKYIKNTFKESVENYIAILTTEIFGFEEIASYIDFDKLKKEYEEQIIEKNKKKRKNRNVLKKRVILLSVIVCLLIGISFGYKMFISGDTAIEDSSILNRINGHDLIAAKNSQSGLYGFINEDGKEMIPFEYRSVSWFDENGHSIVKTQEGYYDVIDKSGNKILNENLIELPCGEGAFLENTNDDDLYIFYDELKHFVKFVNINEGITKEYFDTDLESGWQSNDFFLLSSNKINESDENIEFFVVDTKGNILFDNSMQPRILYKHYYDDSRYIIVNKGNGNYVILDSIKSKQFEIRGNYDHMHEIPIQGKQYNYDRDLGTKDIPYDDMLFYGIKDGAGYLLDIYGNIKKQIENTSIQVFHFYNTNHEIYMAESKDGNTLILDNDFITLLNTDTFQDSCVTKDGIYLEKGVGEQSECYLVNKKGITTVTESDFYFETKDPCYKTFDSLYSGNCILHNLPNYDYNNFEPYIFWGIRNYHTERTSNVFDDLFYDNFDSAFNYSDEKQEFYMSKSILYNNKTEQSNEINGFIIGKLSKALIFAAPTVISSQEYQYLKAGWGAKGKYLRGLVDVNGKVILEANYNLIYEYYDYIVCCDDKNSYLVDKDTYEIVKTYEGILLLG